MQKSIATVVVLGGAVLLVPMATAQIVIQEDFQDDPAGAQNNNYGFTPTNLNRPGQWVPSGHVVSGPDPDWSPQVQNTELRGGMVGPTGSYIAWDDTGADTGTVGVYNMDGIIKFTLADGTPRPAVTGEKIRGSFTYVHERGNFGFGFTDSIAGLQAYQAAMPEWIGIPGATRPLNMPTGFSDSVVGTDGQFHRVGFGPNVTGHIAINNSNNDSYLHAAVDIAENDGLGDGFVDQGEFDPETDPASTDHRPLAPHEGADNIRQTIRWEYIVGDSNYFLLQVDQSGPDDGEQWKDIIQKPSATPNPLGPMPVGKVVDTIEGMFITGGNGRDTRVWYDDILVEIVSPNASILGDANHDGTVDTLDFDMLAGSFNTTTTLIWANGEETADFNGDGVINALDFNVLATNFGASASAPLSGLVPEPSSLSVIGLGILGLLQRRRTVPA